MRSSSGPTRCYLVVMRWDMEAPLRRDVDIDVSLMAGLCLEQPMEAHRDIERLCPYLQLRMRLSCQVATGFE